LKSIEERFAEAEKRVRSLVSENTALKKRVREFEREIAQLRSEARDLQHFHGKRMHVREKIERILNALEAADRNEGKT
jgi:predicted RNase H-like nuclease (RuvC/YqgF family)